MSATDAVAEALAANVRRLRTTQGLTLDALAGRAEVSRGMLIQIEQRRVNPSLATLVRIADALDVGLQELVDLGGDRRMRLVAPDEQAVLWRSAAGGSGRLIVGSDGREHVEAWDWTLRPGDEHPAEAHPAGAREILYVLDGRLTVTAGDEQATAGPGEAIVFSASIDHAYRNDGRRAVRALMVVVTPGAGRT
jgi:quercetin dioxygenase-like cupin family protein/DNA-binding XRE family transcriptional regulator